MPLLFTVKANLLIVALYLNADEHSISPKVSLLGCPDMSHPLVIVKGKHVFSGSVSSLGHMLL